MLATLPANAYVRDPRPRLSDHVNALFPGIIETPAHQAGVDLPQAIKPFRWYSLRQIQVTSGLLATRYRRTQSAMWVEMYERAMEGYCRLLAEEAGE